MTAPAAPPRLTDVHLAKLDEMLHEDKGIVLSVSVKGWLLASLIAEVRSSRAAAERAEGLASALKALLNGYDSTGQRFIPSQEIRGARAALAAYRGNAGRGPTNVEVAWAHGYATAAARAAEVSAGNPGAKGERCQDCGRRYSEVWRAPDALWANVTGRDDGGGLRCMPCFAAKARERGISLYWECNGNGWRGRAGGGTTP